MRDEEADTRTGTSSHLCAHANGNVQRSAAVPPPHSSPHPGTFLHSDHQEVSRQHPQTHQGQLDNKLDQLLLSYITSLECKFRMKKGIRGELHTLELFMFKICNPFDFFFDFFIQDSSQHT